MSSLYLNPFSGIAGDMFLGLLVDLGVEVSTLKDELDLLGVDYDLRINKINKSGIMATSLKPVFVAENESGLSFEEIMALIDNLDDFVAERAKRMFDKLARAESSVHGVPLEEVHFHELGSLDAVIEIAGAVIGLDALGIDTIYSGPVNVGSGFVTIEHGKFPVPAPATAELLKGIPIRLESPAIESELVTPTGAVILNELVDSFDMIEFTIKEIGYGAGEKFLQIPNVLRGFLGRKSISRRDYSASTDYHLTDTDSKTGSARDEVTYSPIGYLNTPYEDSAPYQVISEQEGEFCITLKDKFTSGLAELNKFKYIYVIYGLHLIGHYNLVFEPPWTGKHKGIGVFASRSPNRPNPIGLSIVELNHINRNKLFISSIDAINGAPVLDIKPYIEDLDTKESAGKGWLTEEENLDHLLLHIKGIPH